MLIINHLYKRYFSQGDYLLNDINLTLKEGKIYVLSGKSGSGKTTLANLIVGAIKCDEGKIYYEDKLIANKNFYDRQMHKKITLLNQNPLLSFDPRQTMYHALKESAKVSKHYSNKKEFNDLLITLFNKVNLPLGLLKRKPSALSGGEGQRIALVKAMINQSKIIVGDESLSMVDELNKKDLYALYKDYVKTNDAIFLLISHDEKIIKHAKHVYLLKKGTIVLRGE